MTRERKNPGACQRRGSVTAVLPESHNAKPTAAHRSRQVRRIPPNRRERMRDPVGGVR
jgi:hypothetical protein